MSFRVRFSSQGVIQVRIFKKYDDAFRFRQLLRASPGIERVWDIEQT